MTKRPAVVDVRSDGQQVSRASPQREDTALTSPGDAADARRIETLNIRHGGTKFGDALTTRLLSDGADVFAVTKFRSNAAGERLIRRLQHGYKRSGQRSQGHQVRGPGDAQPFICAGYCDVWRAMHPKLREYSYFSHPGDNGFRLD